MALACATHLSFFRKWANGVFVSALNVRRHPLQRYVANRSPSPNARRHGCREWGQPMLSTRRCPSSATKSVPTRLQWPHRRRCHCRRRFAGRFGYTNACNARTQRLASLTVIAVRSSDNASACHACRRCSRFMPRSRPASAQTPPRPCWPHHITRHYGSR